MRAIHRLSMVVSFIVLATGGACADAVDDFYKGKQIALLVGSGAGGGYDAYARIFARHASKHMAGGAVFIVKNVPAAGGMVAANTLYNNADKDGLTIAAHTNGIAMDPLFGNPGAKFDGTKFAWLGSMGKLQNICGTWYTSKVKTIEDARHTEVTVAGAGATSNTVIVPKILNTLLGTKFKVIAGYEPGQGDTIAIENGEVEGSCGLAWSTIKASRFQWIRDHKLNVLLQMAFDKLPELPDVPSALELVKDPGKRQVLELILIRQEMGRPFAAPPGTPPERVAALRKAFEATMKDPEFLADAQRAQLEIEPLTGPDIDKLLAKAYGAPKDIVKTAADLVEPGQGSK
jgi:tripartite-type tricarboxylate transporter receptor subunit TctC